MKDGGRSLALNSGCRIYTHRPHWYSMFIYWLEFKAVIHTFL